jgi:hypothetical protein
MEEVCLIFHLLLIENDFDEDQFQFYKFDIDLLFPMRRKKTSPIKKETI